MSYDNITMDMQFYTSESRPYGFTYGQWTVKWWQWFLSTPRSPDSLINESSESAYMKQPLQPVWFLAGKVGDERREIPIRHCRVSTLHSILFPVINCEVNPLECPELTAKDLPHRVEEDENTIVLKECSVDGRQLPVQRVKSDPLVFDVTINKKNPFGVKGGGTTSAAADGYWVFLKPLPAGAHHIRFRGSCENGRLNAGADYNLQVE